MPRTTVDRRRRFCIPLGAIVLALGCGSSRASTRSAAGAQALTPLPLPADLTAAVAQAERLG